MDNQRIFLRAVCAGSGFVGLSHNLTRLRPASPWGRVALWHSFAAPFDSLNGSSVPVLTLRPVLGRMKPQADPVRRSASVPTLVRHFPVLNLR